MIRALVATFACIVLALVLAMSGVLWLLAQRCDAQFVSYPHYYGFWEGCMIQVDGNWIPDDNLRVVIQ